MKKITICLALGLSALLVLNVLNLWSIWGLSNRVEYLAGEVYARRSLPCQAVPVRFAMDDPECANELLQAMNVTNVRFIAREEFSDMSNHSMGLAQRISQQHNGT